MRYGPDDKFWVVLDPTPQSGEDDVLFEASLRSLYLQFRGGLTMDRNPTLFTHGEEEEATVEAHLRIVAARGEKRNRGWDLAGNFTRLDGSESFIGLQYLGVDREDAEKLRAAGIPVSMGGRHAYIGARLERVKQVVPGAFRLR